MFFFILEFIAFPERKDSLLSRAFENKENVDIAVSGSLGFRINGKCQVSNPYDTLVSDRKLEWCSNIAQTGSEKPFISYSIRGKSLKLKGYSVRNGCCYYRCCCIDDDHDIDYECCCDLSSFSLQGSNDNVTWKTIHSTEKNKNFRYCEYQTYEFPLTEPFTYVRFVSDERFPGCPHCIQINQIELYGEAFNSYFVPDFDNEDEESVSIIGKVDRLRSE